MKCECCRTQSTVLGKDEDGLWLCSRCGDFHKHLFVNKPDPREPNPKREALYAVIREAVSDIFYYDRKDCEDLTREDVKQLLESMEVSIFEMTLIFQNEMQIQLLENFDISLDSVERGDSSISGDSS